MDYKFGIMGYASNNIGDEIQTLAQMRFLPSVDYICMREKISKFKSKNNDKVKLIMNAWYKKRMTDFPPSRAIVPLPISMHFNPNICDAGFLERPKNREWLVKNGPIGARDTSTLKRLEDLGIPAYFSGCLSLTLLPNNKFREKSQLGKYILAVNLTEQEIAALKQRASIPVYSFNKSFYGGSMQNRLRLARCVLALFHNAHAVVSRNKHTFMPCLAFGTPVLALAKKDGYFTDGFQGLYNLCNHMTSQEFIENTKSYDFDSPPSNPVTYLYMASKLVAVCSNFTGYDNFRSPIDDDFDPLFELVGLLQKNYNQIQRNLYYASSAQLYQALLDKNFRLNSKYTLEDDIKILPPENLNDRYLMTYNAGLKLYEHRNFITKYLFKLLMKKRK
jgi:hypothetical protein